MARASSTKSWLWHQRLSHLNFDTINDLAKNNLVSILPKFKYHKEHLCPSCEQGKSKRASYPPKPVPNSRHRLHLLHMDLCGPMRIVSINRKRYVLVIVDDYSRYTWVHFLRSKEEAPKVIKTFLKRITVLLQSPVIIIRIDNDTEFKNQVLKEYFNSVGISHQVSSVQTPQQNGVVERINRTLVEAARTMLIFSRAPLFLWTEVIATACFTQNCSIIYRRFNKTPYELINEIKLDITFLHVFGALCYPKNDREDIGKLGAKEGCDTWDGGKVTWGGRAKAKDMCHDIVQHSGQPLLHYLIKVAQWDCQLGTSKGVVGVGIDFDVDSGACCRQSKKQKENISINENQKKQQPKVKKTKKVGSIERLASPKPSKPRSFLRVYFIEGLGHNLFSVGQFYDSDLEVAFRRNACFVRNLEGVDLLKGNHSTNLYTINLYEMESTSLIFLMARVSSTKSWLWHQRLSHLNFDTINDLAKNDLVTGLTKFKYHKEHICPSCEQGKSKRASHPPKPVPNSRQRLHLLHMDLCGPMRIASINGKRYVLVIVDDYSRYTWVQFLRSKDEAPEVIKTFLKRIAILLQSPVIIIRTDNNTEFKNHVLKEYFDSVGISHQVSSIRTPQQNGVVEQRNLTLVELARTMLIFSRAPLFLWAEVIATACFTQNRSIIYRRFNKTPYELINGRKPDISFLHVFGALCYPKNDREDIGKLGAKGDIGFFIGYSADSCAYRVFNQSSGLDLTYALSTITTQQPTEGELDLLFEAMYDDYIGGQPSAALRTISAAHAHQIRQTPSTFTSIADTAPTPTNSSSQATNFPNSLQDIDELNSQQQHAQQQGNHAPLQPKIVADNVPNAMFDANTFVNPFATPSTSAVESSSSQYVDPSNMHTFYQPYPHEF
nr:retrovirus-related Pol polyprotein from transposon TNT 1-94 [Tanacetum cinerariifolium]